MSKKTNNYRLVDILRFRRAYVMSDFNLNTDQISVRGDDYQLRKIKQVEVRKLGIKDNMVHVISLALMLSAATWAFVPQFGFLMLALTLILAFTSWRKYELRAEFVATDETGDYWVSIARGCSNSEYKVFQQVESQLAS
ncbi:hypothetical protein [Vibrio sinaloensis]|uniref:hypothetical protein n=1 Tax=Photobacterium sp. (strain ATCC 43367) TaxID=379097 RepID=UPI0022AEB674|nr:hypothetical protein [Vibrio sinaloensis]MCZ4293288.1 hypothetical protein [Vibrio sinaloensis]